MRRTLAWAVVVLAGIAKVGGLSPTPAAPVPKGQAEVDWPSSDSAIYLGCGGVGGPGTVVQLDWAGKVLRTLDLPAAPYGLAARFRIEVFLLFP